MSSQSAGVGSWLRIEVRTREDRFDAEGARISQEIERLLGRAPEVRVVRGYSVAFDGPGPTPDAVARVLVDPVLQEASILAPDDAVPTAPAGWHRVDVVRKPGVMDPVSASVRRAFRTVSCDLRTARTYRGFLIAGDLGHEELQRIGSELLANSVIEDVRLDPDAAVLPIADLEPVAFERHEVPLRNVDDAELERISREGLLALNLAEMRAIQSHFRELDRDPTDVELETLAQTWSEHCKHKTLTATVELPDRRYDNLLKDTIFAATKELDREFCLSVFKDNAGVVTFDDDHAVTFKVETHNHPSALEPYGGAGTGIGGVIRDTMGTGLGARPVLSTDVFCVGPLDMTPAELPKGTLAPRRILQGVVAGVRDYGNRMGIPTPNGAVFVHRGYRANPLVFCGNVGLIPNERIEKQARPGDRVFVLGGRTGRDGIHGATFSSLEFDSAEDDESGAVQIGNAIEEKRLLDACMDARDRGLFTAVTDCGAGGLSSAIGEMGEDCGADVELSQVPLKYEGLSAGEIWISEAQERMVVAVAPEHADELREVCRIHQVEATDLGQFTDTGRLHLTYEGNTVLDMSMEFLHHGLPKPVRQAREPAAPTTATERVTGRDPGELLHALLRHPDITSKEVICRQYDHEVLAGSVIKPMAGPGGFGPSDACVSAPRLGSRRGIVVGCGMSPTTGEQDAYRMALLSIDEAVRNIIASGGRLDRTALLDNFAWPSVNDEESLGAVVLACEACRDAALAWRTPFISGKDSLNNQLATPDGTIRIPPTLLISALSVIEDVTRAVTMDLKQADHDLYLVGNTTPELGGARFTELTGGGGQPPTLDLKDSLAIHQAVEAVLAAGHGSACHDLSEGGLAVALAEMGMAGELGVDVSLADVPATGDLDRDTLLFAESPTRYLIEVPSEHRTEVESALQGIPHQRIGRTTTERRILIHDANGQELVNAPLDTLTEAFRTGLGI